MTFTEAIEHKIQNYIPGTPILVFAPPAIGVMSAIGLDLNEADIQQYFIDCHGTDTFDIHETILDICEQNPDNQYVFVFDEIDRTPKERFPEVCNAIFTRQCNGHQIPDNVTICARISWKSEFENTHFESADAIDEFYRNFMTIQSHVESLKNNKRGIGFRLWR